MTPLTGASDQADISTPALRSPPKGRKRPLSDALADPRVRLGAGTAALLVTAVAVRRDRVGRCEAAAFRAVNGLPSSLYPPAWVVMQLGTLGAAPAAAGVAWLAGDRELAGRLLAGGTGTWALSKVFKQMVRRPRPAALLPGTRVRGREAAGLGYLSGHAGVAVALGAAAFPHLGKVGRAVTLSAAPVVGLTRIYVGAHLPLDVAGGAALGFVIEAALTLGRRPAARRACGGRRTRVPDGPPARTGTPRPAATSPSRSAMTGTGR
jgi:membrane-associated phospholipid phosphatase